MKTTFPTLALGLTALTLQACASYHRPDEVTAQMARTQVVIQQADRSGVAVNSLPELQAAKDKYTEARIALEKKTPEGDQKALQLAKQAEVDAQYASAKAQSTTQEAAARDAQKGVEDLRKEAGRNATATEISPPRTEGTR